MCAFPNPASSPLHFSPPKPHHNVFSNRSYFARPYQSTIVGRSGVNSSREMLPPPADFSQGIIRRSPIVVPVPDSGVPAAVVSRHGIPHSISHVLDSQSLHSAALHRAIASDSQFRRQITIKSHFAASSKARVILVDDSIVQRGCKPQSLTILSSYGVLGKHSSAPHSTCAFLPATISSLFNYGVVHAHARGSHRPLNLALKICQFLLRRFPRLHRSHERPKQASLTPCLLLLPS